MSRPVDPTATTDLAGKQVLVTGASAGIGEATARLFAAEGADLVVCARRMERLESLKKEVESEHGVSCEPVELDVSDRAALDALGEARPEVFEATDVLVNNAGLARGREPLQGNDPEEIEEVVRTNVLGLLQVTRKVLPHMVERGEGHVVNLGSVAGRWVYPGGTVYCASKHAVRAVSEGLRLDVRGTGVRVTDIEPGMVETEFSEVRFGDAGEAAEVYEGMRPLVADDIARTILWCVKRPAHVNIQEVVIYPTDQAGITTVDRREE